LGLRRSSRRRSPEGDAVAAIAARPSGGGLTVRRCLVLTLLFSRSSPSSCP
jgi:hypothetical protein